MGAITGVPQILQLFSTREELHAHLETFPSHKTPFKPKVYNVLDFRAQHGGERKCWTCGRHFTSLGALKNHLKWMDHAREGMIPRWKIHNGWFDRKGAAHKARRRALGHRGLKMGDP